MEKTILQQRIFASVFQLSNRLQAEGDKLADDLTLKQWFLLLLLYKGPLKDPTVNDLAAAMGVTRQSAKKMVSTLEKGQYLSVEKSPSDSRALCIRPTQKAYLFFKHNKSLGFELLDRVFEGIEAEEMNAAFLVLRKMKSNLREINAGKTERTADGQEG